MSKSLWWDDLQLSIGRWCLDMRDGFKALLSAGFWRDFADYWLTAIEWWPRNFVVLHRRYRNPWQWRDDQWWRL